MKPIHLFLTLPLATGFMALASGAPTPVACGLGLLAIPIGAMALSLAQPATGGRGKRRGGGSRKGGGGHPSRRRPGA